MRKIKIAYLLLLGGWLLVCAVRVALPWLRDDAAVEFFPGDYWVSCYVGNQEVGARPASIYAELNERLEAMQPGIHAYFSPWCEWQYNCQGVITCSLREDKPSLSPAAVQVWCAWMQENNVFEPPMLRNSALRDAPGAEVDGAHDEPCDEAAEPVQRVETI